MEKNLNMEISKENKVLYVLKDVSKGTCIEVKFHFNLDDFMPYSRNTMS